MPEEIKTAAALDALLTQAKTNPSIPQGWPKELPLKPVSNGNILFTAPDAGGKDKTYSLWMTNETDPKFVGIAVEDVATIIGRNVPAIQGQRATNGLYIPPGLSLTPEQKTLSDIARRFINPSSSSTFEPGYSIGGDAIRGSSMIALMPQQTAQNNNNLNARPGPQAAAPAKPAPAQAPQNLRAYVDTLVRSNPQTPPNDWRYSIMPFYQKNNGNDSPVVVSVTNANGQAERRSLWLAKGADGNFNQPVLLSGEQVVQISEQEDMVEFDQNLKDRLKASIGAASDDDLQNYMRASNLAAKIKIIDGKQKISVLDLNAGSHFKTVTGSVWVDNGDKPLEPQPVQVFTQNVGGNRQTVVSTDSEAFKNNPANGYLVNRQMRPGEIVNAEYTANGGDVVLKFDARSGKFMDAAGRSYRQATGTTMDPYVAGLVAQTNQLIAAAQTIAATPPSTTTTQAALNGSGLIMNVAPLVITPPQAAVRVAPQPVLKVGSLQELAALDYKAQLAGPANMEADAQRDYSKASGIILALPSQMATYLNAKTDADRKIALDAIARAIGGEVDPATGNITGGVPDNYKEIGLKYVRAAMAENGGAGAAIASGTQFAELRRLYQGPPGPRAAPVMPTPAAPQQPPAAPAPRKPDPVTLGRIDPQRILPANLPADKLQTERVLYIAAKKIEDAMNNKKLSPQDADALIQQFSADGDDIYPGFNHHAVPEYYLRLKNEQLGSQLPGSFEQDLYNRTKDTIQQTPAPAAAKPIASNYGVGGEENPGRVKTPFDPLPKTFAIAAAGGDGTITPSQPVFKTVGDDMQVAAQTSAPQAVKLPGAAV